MSPSRSVCLFAFLVAATAGCTGRTELMVGVITDIRAPDILDFVKLQIFHNGDLTQTPLEYPWDIPGQPNTDFALPGSFGLSSGDGSGTKVELVLTGQKNNVRVVERRALVSLVPGQTLFMRMGLVVGCMSKFDCATDQSCIEGACKAKMVDNRTLPAFVTDLVNHVTCGTSQFVDTGTRMVVPPMGDMQCAGGQCVEGTCYQPPKVDTGGGGNGTCQSSQYCNGKTLVTCADATAMQCHFEVSGHRYDCVSCGDCTAAAQQAARVECAAP